MDLVAFRKFLAAYRGGPNEHVSWADVARWGAAEPERFAQVVSVLAAEADGEFDLGAPIERILLEAPPAGTDYERWAEKKRRRANLNALAALRQFQAHGGVVPTPAERAAMEAYTGWGGFRDIQALPPDGRIFPSLYVQGIEAWRKAADRGALPHGPGADLFRGLLQQYFTSLDASEGLWRLACRVSPFPVRDALEPSAGVGRVLRAAQSSTVRWTAVEMDPLLAEFLRALYPTADVQESTFEAFAREVSKAMQPGSGWDLVIGNPPYPERPSADRNADPKFSGWHSADTYFTVRSASMLRPGGVLVFLTPASNIIGNSAENRDLRAYMLKHAHFAGAVFTPASIFPNVAMPLAIQVWVRRGAESTTLTEFERDVLLPGRYLETAEGQANTAGVWKTRRGQHGEQSYVDGKFAPSFMDTVQLYPLPVEELEQIRRARGDTTPVPVAAKPGTKAPAVAQEPAGSLLVQEARALNDRLLEFFRRLGLGAVEVALAESGRDELKADLRAFLARHGHPNGLREIRADRKRFAALTASFNEDGTLIDGVEVSRGLAQADAPPAGAPPLAVVEFFSRRNGVCTDYDLHAYFENDVADELLAESSVAVEYRPDGTRWWYRNEEFTTGDLYGRLANLDAMLETVEEPAIRTKLEDQKVLLLHALGELELSDIDVNPRSGFVPPECLTVWLVDTIYNAEVQEAMKSSGDYRARKSNIHQGHAENVPRRPIVAYVEDGRLRLSGVTEPISDDNLRWLAFVVAYWNRSLRVEDPTGNGTRMDAFNREQADVESRMAAEDALATQFKAWLQGQPEWGPRITQAYNHAYRGFRAREYDTGPLPIARLGPHPRGYTLQAHQNSSVRRLEDRGSGVLALDVGLGKTASALAAVAYNRQSGRASRALVAVPNSVLGKWWKEASEWLPSYRIGVIGLTLGKRGVRSDTPAERAEKWQRLAQGAYELCICTHQNFLDDVALSDERTAELVSEMFWLQRDLGLNKEERRVLEARVEAAKGQLTNLAADIAKNQADLDTFDGTGGRKPAVPHRWSSVTHLDRKAAEVRHLVRSKTAKGEELERAIAKWEDALSQPTASEIEKAREAASGFIADKPFRPSKDRPLVDWGSLGVDMLVVDEAHAYKNIWKPTNRFGKSIKYMGGMEQKAKMRGRKRGEEDAEESDEDESGKVKGKRTIRAWDMYLKTQDLLERNDDRGVVLLTATPVTNSPIEVYNLVSLVSRRVWQTRQVRNKEEFVDRYCRFEEQLIADGITGGAQFQLVMSDFVALDELRSVLTAYVEYRTTQQVLAWQVQNNVPEERRLRVPDDVSKQVTIPLDPVQAEVYQQLREHIVGLQKELKEAKAPPKEISALNLVLSDLLSKAALDPRLLVEDVEKIQTVLESEDDPEVARRLERRLGILNASGAGEAAYAYRKSGAVPEKYLMLAQNIAARPGVGHIIFCDYKMAFEEIIRVLVEQAKVPRSRIVTLTGDDDKADRSAIANGLLVLNPDGTVKSNTGGFNGRDAIVQGEGTGNEVVIDPGADPAYDVILGTSGAMSEGIDLQRRTGAIHHLNYQWVTSVIQQRNGRGVRQGNQFSTVDCWYYLSERTIDVVRLSVTWGKGNWLASLFGEAQSIANPAASLGSDVEEAIAEMFAPNPEAAAIALEKARAERRAERLKKNRARAQAKFISLVAQYKQYRRITDPVTQAAKMSAADHMAEQLRALPREVFGRPNLLALARKEEVFYDIDSGVHFTRGARFTLALRGNDVPAEWSEVESTIEILDFAVTPGRESVTATIEYRNYGTLLPYTATSVRELLGSVSPKGRGGHREPVPTEVGQLEQRPTSWADASEVKSLTLHKAMQLRYVPKLMAATLGDAVWARAIEALKNQWAADGHDVFVPLRPSSAPGEVWLLPEGTMGRLHGDLAVALTVQPLYPSEDASWRMFCEAVRTGRLRYWYWQDKTVVGNTAAPVVYVQRVEPLKLVADASTGQHMVRMEIERVQRTSQMWFGRLLPDALFAEAARRAGSKAPTR